MKTTEIIRTVVCPLETSNRKNEKLKRAVDDFRTVAEVAATILPTFQEHARKRTNNQIYQTVKSECQEWEIKDKVAQNAVHRVIDNFKSTRELGNDLPKDGIPECDFLILTDQGYDIEPNDRGYGFKAKFIPYKPEWWSLDIGEHQQQYLNRAIEGEARLGQAELSYNDGNPVVRIAVTWEQEVTEPSDAKYTVGVDIGYRTLYAAAVRNNETGEIVDVEVEPGNEFQHKRKAIQNRLTRFKRNGKLDRANELRERRRKYTDQTLHRVATDVVDMAESQMPCVIRLEDLTDYRVIEDDPMHDWPFKDLQQKIETKANAEGIGVVVDDPYYTSQTCRKCGYQDKANRDGLDFECLSCGYQVNADVNAAMNLSKIEV